MLLSEQVRSEQIEDILAKLSAMGVNVVDFHEADSKEDVTADDEPEPEQEEETAAGNEIVEVRQQSVAVKSKAKELAERTDDPVRMYLREMGAMELLSREGEIAIAKRIEAGREAMIAGLCESPLTFQAIVIWRDELNNGKALLRDIIDIDATYAGPDAKAPPAPQTGPDGLIIAGMPVADQSGQLPQVPEVRHRARGRRSDRTSGRNAPIARSQPATARATSTMMTTRRIGSRSPQSRRSSSRKLSSFSMPLLTPTSGCAVCRTRTSSSSLEDHHSRLLKSASIRS